jgi:Flp pilus assembly protein TadB
MNARANEAQTQADWLAIQASAAEQLREDALTRPPVDRPDRAARPMVRRAGIAVCLVAGVALIWLVGGNTAGLIAGALAAVAVLALSVRWRLKRP